MKRKKGLIIRIIFILSLSFNTAFTIHLFLPAGVQSEAAGPTVELNLSEHQKKQISPVQEKIHKENEALKQKIATCQNKLLTALKQNPVNRGEVNNCIDEINAYQKQLQKNTIDEIIRIRQYMTDHQCNCLIDGIGAAMQNRTHKCTAGCCSPK